MTSPIMFDREIFQHRLNNLRQTYKLTVSQLANSISVSTGLIGHWENGHRVPSIEAAYSLANYFCVSIDYLLGRDDDPQYETYLPMAEKFLLEDMHSTFIKLFNYAKSKEPITTNNNWILIRWFSEWKQITLEYNDYYTKLEKYNKTEDEKHMQKLFKSNPFVSGIQPRTKGIWELFKQELHVKKPQIVANLYADKTNEDLKRDAILLQNLQRLIGINIELSCTPIPNHLSNYLYPITVSDVKNLDEAYMKRIPD